MTLAAIAEAAMDLVTAMAAALETTPAAAPRPRSIERHWQHATTIDEREHNIFWVTPLSDSH